jgi:sugar fermentation stimulation protein A
MLLRPWSGDLISGKLIRRRHRFLLDVILDDGRKVVAHCVNPGMMEGLVIPGAKIWLSQANGKKRRLNWIWELVEINGLTVCANSWSANKLVKSLLEARLITGLKRYSSFAEEVKLGKSNRIDFKVTTGSSSHFIEVKSLQQAYGKGIGYFPDSKTIRSVSHLDSLVAAQKFGQKITLLIVVQRKDVKIVRLSDAHDLIFCDRLRAASKLGLRVRAILLAPSSRGFIFKGEVPVNLNPYNSQDLVEWKMAMKPFSGWSRTKADPEAGWRRVKKAKV